MNSFILYLSSFLALLIYFLLLACLSCQEIRRLQNSRSFCERQHSNERPGASVETASENEERRNGRVRLARFTRKDHEKTTVLQSRKFGIRSKKNNSHGFGFALLHAVETAI